MAEDLESSTKAAWDEFERRLVARLDSMEEDDLLLVEVPGDEEQEGATPYVQFCAWGDDMVRAEAVSNHYLADGWALSERAGSELVTLGFSAPTHTPDDPADSGSANFFVDVPRDESFDLGWMTVVALRDVYGVPHPSLLDADGVVDPAPEPASTAPAAGHDCDPADFEAHVVDGPAALQELVDAALEPVFGHPPKKDDDGDIPINTEHSVVFVCVHGTTPVVDVWGWVVTEVTDRALALHEVSVANRDNLEVQFVLLDGRILARRRVDAMPFVAAQLRRAVDLVCAAVDKAHEDLAPRFRAATGDGDHE
jgi:hypothetical protein